MSELYQGSYWRNFWMGEKYDCSDSVSPICIGIARSRQLFRSIFRWFGIFDNLRTIVRVPTGQVCLKKSSGLGRKVKEKAPAHFLL
jgi:hypothetical protein